jgi:orotate phosphoribosyltransferase
MLEKILEETGAIKKGHFLLASGLHSEFYFQAQSMLQYPQKAQIAAAEIAALWNDTPVETVVSLAIGGIVLGQELAREINARHIFLERKQGHFSLERGFVLNKSEKILLVEDVITTGGSLKEAIELLHNYNVEITGITSLVLRGDPEFKFPLKSALKLEWPKFKPEDCPLCKNGKQLKIPGTKQSSLK